MLPRPSLSFAIPSLHDHTHLDCRIYHPDSLNAYSNKAPRWGRHVAIVAHPYAPLGGSYDDPIVDLVGGTLLQLGFMVATFNFRGASSSSASSSSGARTSWTSKAEQADYMSIVGFVTYYTQYLDFPNRISTDHQPIMLQAGYSYGAMITTKLPPLQTILALFEHPATHTPAADIRLRAQHLAEQQNQLATIPASPRKSLGMRMGGDDDEIPQKSHEIRRSHSLEREERIRKGVKELLARTKLIHRKHRHKPHDAAEEVVREEQCMDRVPDLIAFRSAYLAVSPPIGFMTNLATMSFANPFHGWFKKHGKMDNENRPVDHQESTTQDEHDAAQMKLIHYPSLTVYGDSDGFLTLRKFREWTSKLEAYNGSSFQHVEVPGAGHFWVEEGVYYVLRDAVGDFGTMLIKSGQKL
ncbi:Alpha/Beta hydrolase protein [Xylariales sp. PMI_506]|nr:Alpha/Beta hydrolase protein [Xylariales sp. PMI_506]